MRPAGTDRRRVLERRSARGRGALWRAEERSLGAGALARAQARFVNMLAPTV